MAQSACSANISAAHNRYRLHALHCAALRCTALHCQVDFNAGVVAAGEARIESTVTGNSSNFQTQSKPVSFAFDVTCWCHRCGTVCHRSSVLWVLK